MNPVYIYDAIRTPRARAKPTGGLHDLKPQQLLRALYNHLHARGGLDPALIGDIVLGCVTQHGDQAGNIAKTSALYAGWPTSVGGITVNRFCSSSIDAINMAALRIGAGQEQAMIAGGVEMMSRVPMLSDNATVFVDPAFAARCSMLMMGSGADLIATLNGINREQADELALQSQRRAAHARQQGYFKSIIPIDNPSTGKCCEQDECIRPEITLPELQALAPAFAELGAQGVDQFQLAAHPVLERIEHIHTAGNSPAMADAAAVVLLGNEQLSAELGVAPRARIVAAASASDDPMQVLTGCTAAAAKLMHQQEITAEDIDLFEVHEAFAATIINCAQTLDIPTDKLNVNGGVIALGHPMGATGAIMTGMLLDELERRDQRLGLVSASGAAGAGSALLIERV